MIELRDVSKADIAELIRQNEQNPLIEKWVLFVERGPVMQVDTYDSTTPVTLRTAGPRAPYSGALVFVYTHSKALTEAVVDALKVKADLGKFNTAAFPARFRNGRTIEQNIDPAFWT